MKPAPAPTEAPEPSRLALSRAWDRFWFAPADPIVLGLLRICTGLIVLYVHLAYSFDLQAFFGPEAWLNRAALDEFRADVPLAARSATSWQDYPAVPEPPYSQDVRNFFLNWEMHPVQAPTRGYYAWSIWYHVADPFWIRVTHIAVLCNLVLFTIGFGTRLTAVIAWLSTLSYIQRAHTMLFGMDTITNLALLYLMIGPSGAALSVDGLLQRYWKKQPISAPPRVSANFALRLFQIHLCIIYFVSGISKLQGQAWWNATAIWYTLANPEFSPLHHAFFVDVLRFLCENRWLWELVMSFGAVFTLAFEISFSFLIWNRHVRWTMIVAAMLLHLGIALFMGLTTFSLIMITCVLSFVPAEAVRGWVEKFDRSPRRAASHLGRRATFQDAPL